MTVISYYSHGQLHRLNAQSASRLMASATTRKLKAGPREGMRSARAMAPVAIDALHAQKSRVEPLMLDIGTSTTMMAFAPKTGQTVIPTPTLVLQGTGRANVKRLSNEFGLEIIDEGEEGKILLRAPDAGPKGVEIAAEAARKAYKEGYARVAHPNFIRLLSKVRRSAAGGKPLWNHNNDGQPGVAGADVAAPAAWTITRGEKEIRVAVLDEGVDTKHPALQSAVVKEKDFVDGNSTAMPDGNDAHGTACSGIIVSRSDTVPGLAPNCSLVAVRIAKGVGEDDWVFNDYKTADAIDWSWKEAKADVLSLSWGTDPPVDVITNALLRARTKGRSKKGCVIAVAAGNENVPIGYPATLPNVLAVGASNPWDERKTKKSKDGEDWWASSYGSQLSLLAPGVQIASTDIRGARGYTNGLYVYDFNGTSSATPHIAAAAALVLSVKPKLKENEVRNFLTASADRLATNGRWDRFVGWGRLNIFSALRMARR